jgi:hypothetical protein
VKTITLLLLLLLALPAKAAEFKFELGPDIVHAGGLRVWSVSVENENSRFRYGRFGQDGIEVEFYGAEYVWRPWKHCAPSLGLVHIDHLTPLNGTHWNFQLGLQCQVSERVFVGFMHFSHGRGLGIEENKTNNGFNFLTVGTGF